MDQNEAYRKIWQTFVAAGRVADGRHDTSEWRAHRGVFAACIIRVPASALQPDLAALGETLAALPFTRVHPDHFLHIMLQELGFLYDRPTAEDELSRARLDEFASAAAGAMAERKPFRLTLGGANSFADAAFLEVQDRGQCARLHHRLRELVGAPGGGRFSFLPHVTLAHYTADAPAGDLAPRIAGWRNRVFGTIDIRQIEIVTLRLDTPYPPLSSYAIIPLGS